MDRRFEDVRRGGAAGREALWHLLNDAMPEIWGFVRAHVPDDADAEELTRRVMYAVIRAYDGGTELRFAYDRSSLFKYLLTAAGREVARYTARRRRGYSIPAAPADLEPALTSSAPSPPEEAGTREFWQWVHEALSLLSPRDCTLVYCAFRLELTGADLAAAAGLTGYSNISVLKSRALKRFVARLAAVWVARSAGTLGCAGLTGLLGGRRTIAPEGYDAVAAHITGCAACGAEADTIRLARSGAAVLKKFRTLPLLPVPAALQAWLDRQRDTDPDRRRTIIEIVTGWFSRPVPSPVAVLEGAVTAPDAPPGRLERGRDRVQALVASVTRQPAVAAVVSTAQQHPGAVAAAGTAGAVVVAVVAGVLSSTLSSDAADRPVVAVTSASTRPPSAAPKPPPASAPATTAAGAPPVATTAPPTTAAPTTTAPTTTAPPAPAPTPTTPAPVVTPAPTRCAAGWTGIAMPPAAAGIHYIAGIAATGPSDVWAVGQSGRRSLLAHYDGSAWQTFPSPNPGTGANLLSDVAARSRTDAWAVGYGDNGAGDGGDVPVYSIAVHWDGTTWTERPLPAGLFASAVVMTATDVWVLGYTNETQYSSEAAVLRWNGGGWTRIAAPSPLATSNLLRAAAASGPSDVWAVGGDWGGDPLVEHWDGVRWSAMPRPPVAGRQTLLRNVEAAGPADVWVGGLWVDTVGTQRPYAAHWDGRQWTVAALPDVGAGSVHGVTVFGPGDAWLLGLIGEERAATRQPLALHWDGTRWTRVAAGPVGGKFLDGVRTGGHEFVAAGYIVRPGPVWNGDEATLIARRCTG
ncbi:sigma-70 family RNA polymerase sigma factor [Dactylosporangium vinaceum]|uniref:Sigma-70 family RNA polymerase sigma factor n=1 Tax=Dactylosporangium vinaceum TaxID=53362 RepID=A0ABV5MJL1_9ACTN|nr:sigma-70 family RNA polymerase sigma factor [Dactylosporangium vinaceum]UAB92626.1 sigma-70 family RNA polymerase sigma factor [Dactylosporangium vinaceum]